MFSKWVAEASPVADDEDPSLDAMRQMGPAVLPHLMAALKTGKLPTPTEGRKLQPWDVQPRVGEILKGLGTNAAPLASALSKYLDHRDERVRQEAAEILGCTGALNDEVLRSLLRTLSDSKCAFQASTSLAQLGKTHTNVVHELAKVTKAADRTAASWATVALEQLGPRSAAVLPLLLELTQDKAFDTRLAAVRTLALIEPKDPSAIRALIQALDDQEQWVRKCAVIALGRIGPLARASVPKLRALLEKSEPAYTRADIARALWQIEPEAPQVPLRIAQTLIDEGLQTVHRGEGIPFALTSALFLLAEMGTNALSAVPAVVRAQQLNEPTIQFNAAWAACHIDRNNCMEAQDRLRKIINIESHSLDPKLQGGGPIGQVLAAPKRARESYHIRLAAVGALWQLDPRSQTELRYELVSLLKQWTHWTSMKSPIPELQVLIPVLKDILADTSMANAHPFASKVLDQITGTAGERW